MHMEKYDNELYYHYMYSGDFGDLIKRRQEGVLAFQITDNSTDSSTTYPTTHENIQSPHYWSCVTEINR